MSISLHTALNAYNNAASIGKTSISAGAASQTQGAASNFGQVVANSVSDTAASLRSAEQLATRSLVGGADITDVVSAVSNAELTLQTMVAVRDRFVSALQEIMRMPI